MDKHKLIDEILAEWAMRSPDGLVGGHNSPQNAALFREILREHGLIEAAPTKQGELSFGSSEFVLGFTANGLEKEKGFSKEAAKQIIKVAAKALGPVEFKRFADEHYNKKKSPVEAVDFLNSTMGDPKYAAFYEKLDDKTVRRAFSATQVGRGEWILAILLKGCKTMGQRSGDLDMPGFGSIDVKELDDKGQGIFRVPLTVFGGGFGKIRFPRAVNQFFSYCGRTPEAVEVLVNLIDEIGIKDQGHVRAKTFTLRLLEDLSWDGINVSSVNGLLTIMAHLQNLTPKEMESAGLGDKVEFDIDDKEYLMSIDKITPSEKQKIANPSTTSEPVTVAVSAITDRRNAVIIPELRKLELFSRPGKGSPPFTTTNIAQELFQAMEHYDGGIIFYEQGVGYSYEKDLMSMKPPFLFYNYNQSSVSFKRKR